MLMITLNTHLNYTHDEYKQLNIESNLHLEIIH